MSDILADPFLVKQNIIASPSQFLADEYQKEIKCVENPRDMYGSKMSTDWGTGDQAYTVGIRRIIDRLDLLLDPDTYTMKSMLQLKKSLQIQQVAILTLMVTTANVYGNQIAAVRRLYTMDKHKFYDFLAKNLNIKNKMKTKKEMEQELFK